mgnify:CR=1 FL=1
MSPLLAYCMTLREAGGVSVGKAEVTAMCCGAAKVNLFSEHAVNAPFFRGDVPAPESKRCRV